MILTTSVCNQTIDVDVATDQAPLHSTVLILSVFICFLLAGTVSLCWVLAVNFESLSTEVMCLQKRVRCTWFKLSSPRTTTRKLRGLSPRSASGEVKHSCAAPKCVDIAFKAFDGKLLDNGSSRHLSGHIDIVTQKDGEENETWRDHLHKQSLCTPSPRNHIDLCKFSALVEVVLGLWKI